MRLARITMVFLAILILKGQALAQGCAMCKMTAETSKETESSGLANGLNDGILYLMIVPYILLFFLFRKKIVKFFKELSSMQRQ